MPHDTITYRYVPLRTNTYHFVPLRTVNYIHDIHYIDDIPCHTISYHTMTWHNICISWLSKPAKEHVGWFLKLKVSKQNPRLFYLCPSTSTNFRAMPLHAGISQCCGSSKMWPLCPVDWSWTPQDTPKHNKRAQFSPLPRDSNPCLKSQAHTDKTQV